MMLSLLIAALAPVETIGIHGAWGAFRDASPLRCYAMAAPVQRRRAAFVAVGDWPGTGTGGQVHVRLSRQRSETASVTLAIGERRFRLAAGRRDAWSPDAATDRAIVAAMRGSRSLSIETVARDGRVLVDAYRLNGAATAIDAARVACANQRGGVSGAGRAAAGGGPSVGPATGTGTGPGSESAVASITESARRARA